MMRTAFCFGSVLTLLSGIGCGPSFSTQVRWDVKPFDPNEAKQEKDGLIVEDRGVKEFPPSFYATVQACTPAGGSTLAVDQMTQKPLLEKISFASPNQVWYQLAITNHTDHVVRLNTAVIRLFDPAGNQIEPISKDDLSATFLTNRPCPSSQPVANQIRLLKMIDRNVELLPDSTTTGWLAFNATTWPLPGIWKVTLYEVPVSTSEAGQVTKTTRFEVRNNVKKFVDTYKQDGMFSAKVLVETKESSD